MDEPSLSPSTLTKRMFGDSADEDEVLTPGQRPNPEPVPTPRVNPANTQPPPPGTETTAPTNTTTPTDPIKPPAPKKPRLDPEFVKARFGLYERRTKQRKDTKGKAKSSPNPFSGFKPLASQSGNGMPAPYAATFPSTFIQYNHGHSSTAPQQPFNTGMAPPPNPMPWGVGGPYSGTQGLPSYSNPYPGFNHTMPQQSAFPPWLHSQWTALPYQGLGVAPPMDRHWPFTQPQQG